MSLKYEGAYRFCFNFIFFIFKNGQCTAQTQMLPFDAPHQIIFKLICI